MQVVLDGEFEVFMLVFDDIVCVCIDCISGKLIWCIDYIILFEYFLWGIELIVYVFEDDIDDLVQQDEESVDVEEIF